MDTFGYTGYNSRDNEIVLAFRGTNGADFMNWVTNMVYYRVQYEDVSGSQVHSGFYTAYSSVASRIRSSLKSLISAHPGATLMITGHSLGGALATFAALDIKRNIKPSNQILFYTFGSPRCGNQVFTDYVMTQYPRSYNRVTHYTDLVVQMPTRGMGFSHAGDEAWYYNSGNSMSYKVCANYVG